MFYYKQCLIHLFSLLKKQSNIIKVIVVSNPPKEEELNNHVGKDSEYASPAAVQTEERWDLPIPPAPGG